MMKDKPHNVLIRDFIQRRMSVDVAVEEEIIRKVITHCFSNAYDAFADNDTIELSGFGKFIFNRSRAIKYKNKLESQIKYFIEILDMDVSERKKDATRARLKSLKKNLELLNKRMEK